MMPGRRAGGGRRTPRGSPPDPLPECPAPPAPLCPIACPTPPPAPSLCLGGGREATPEGLAADPHRVSLAQEPTRLPQSRF